jgi:transcription antitermination factor NusG
MSITTTEIGAVNWQPELHADYLEPRWYATHTACHHEKRVAEQLQRKSIEFFLPTYQAIHQWKDRRKKLELALFPGYLFVCIALLHKMHVLEIPSVVRLVGFGGRPLALPDFEIERLRTGLEHVRAEPYPYLRVGQLVRIRYGPLEGVQGILLRKKNNTRVVISVNSIMRSFVVDVPAEDLELVR